LHRRVTERQARPWLGWVLLLAVAAGLVSASVGAWRAGLLVVGVTLGLAAALRLLAPGVPLGTLSVRAGWLDATFLGAAAGVLLVAAIALG
jgi:hypothetical protein